jgi:hypothetical protein
MPGAILSAQVSSRRWVEDGAAEILLDQGLEAVELGDGKPAEYLDEVGLRGEALLDGAGSH